MIFISLYYVYISHFPAFYSTISHFDRDRRRPGGKAAATVGITLTRRRRRSSIQFLKQC